MRSNAFAFDRRMLAGTLALLVVVSHSVLFAQSRAQTASKAPLAQVLGEPRSVSVAQAFGVVTDVVPISVPPGRHDVEPHLSLTYKLGGRQRHTGHWMGFEHRVHRVEPQEWPARGGQCGLL